MQVLSGLGSLQFVIIPVASRFMLGIRASAPTALGVGVVLLGEGCWLRCGRKVVGRGCGSACRTVHAMRSPTFCCGPSGVTLATEQLRCQWALAPWTARPSPTLPPTTATGNALIILYGPAEVTFTLGQLRHQWATPAMTTFLVVLGGLLCVLQWMHWRLGRAARAAAGLQPSLAAAMEGGGGKPSVELDAGGGRTLLPAGSGKWVGSVGGGTPIPLAPSGGSMGPLGLFPLLGPRDHDTVTVFAGALLFSAVASFVGAWSVLFSKSLTYVVSYMPGSLTDWCGVLVGWGGVAGKGASGSWQANTRWRDAEPGAEPSTPARPPESALCNNPLARWSPHRPRRPTSFACFYLVELLLLGSPNPTQPNPTQPNPTQPNPTQVLLVCAGRLPGDRRLLGAAERPRPAPLPGLPHHAAHAGGGWRGPCLLYLFSTGWGGRACHRDGASCCRRTPMPLLQGGPPTPPARPLSLRLPNLPPTITDRPSGCA